jgi:hypothetical protein
MKIEYNMYSKSEMEDTIAERGLKEISFEEIKNYTFTDTMNIAVYDDFDVHNKSNMPHYMVDYDEDDYDTLFFGHMYADLEDCERFEVEDIVAPIVGKFDGKYDSSAENVYLVPVGGSLDEEYALGYNAFTNEEDADLYLSLYENGEVAPYIFINSDYQVAVEHHPVLKDIKYVCAEEFPELLKTKNVVLKQPVFAGLDIYN